MLRQQMHVNQMDNGTELDERSNHNEPEKISQMQRKQHESNCCGHNENGNRQTQLKFL